MDKIAYLEDSDFTSSGQLLIGEPTICLVYANWCPPCQAFKPTYYELANVVSNVRISCIELDGHLPGQKELADRIKIILPDLNGTPSIYMFVSGLPVEKYEGDRTLDGLVAFCSKY